MLRALLDPTRWPLAGGCQICLAWGRARLCTDCLARFAPPTPRCPACALALRDGTCPDCLRDRLPLDGTVCAVDYAAPWAELLQGLKYHGQLSAAPALAAVLASAVQAAGAAQSDMAVLPVPLHPRRLAERGYNQSQVLARALLAHLPGQMAPAWVQRVDDQAPLAQSPSREARWRQLKHAFVMAPQADVRGRHVALVDDVMTTGATMSALATLLRRHGAASVQAWAVARTPRPHD